MIGIELCQEAVEDAKANAEANGRPEWHYHCLVFLSPSPMINSHFRCTFSGLTNVEFHCGKAEDVFSTVLNAVVSPNVTAIVDPPRAGLRAYSTLERNFWLAYMFCLSSLLKYSHSHQIPKLFWQLEEQSIWRDSSTSPAMPKPLWTILLSKFIIFCFKWTMIYTSNSG